MSQLAGQKFFDSFDCAFNAIDEAKLRQLLSAKFIQRGENLLILGETGSGKSAIAYEIESEARLLGLRSTSLPIDFNPYSATHFLQRPNPFNEDSGPQLFTSWLEPNLLIVEHAHRWLELAPYEFIFLLGQRIALGKSNVLLISSRGWRSAANLQAYERKVHTSSTVGILSEIAHAAKFRWAEKLTSLRTMSLELQVQLLGIGFTNWDDPRKKELVDFLNVPSSREAHALMEEFDLCLFAWCDQSLTEWMQGPGWKPVWQVLYTGDKNYRRKPEGRI